MVEMVEMVEVVEMMEMVEIVEIVEMVEMAARSSMWIARASSPSSTSLILEGEQCWRASRRTPFPIPWRFVVHACWGIRSARWARTVRSIDLCIIRIPHSSALHLGGIARGFNSGG